MASTEIEKLRRDNEELRKFREDERLKRSQEMEQRNKVECVISPQGAMSVVRDLIGITRRMKQQLGQTLKMETVEIITGARVTGTCKTRHEVTTSEKSKETKIQEVMGDEVTELAETREIEGGLKALKDEHTHTLR